MAWALLAGVARLLISAGGGWLAVHWFGGGPVSVFLAVALGFTVFGLGQLLAIRWTLPIPRTWCPSACGKFAGIGPASLFSVGQCFATGVLLTY